MTYIDKLAAVFAEDERVLRKKDVEYGGSWLKRGGVGAFMMLCRKWDRLETQLSRSDAPFCMDGGRSPSKYDIFEHVEADPRAESVLDDIRDLRRYLGLVEAELVARGVVTLTDLAARSAPKEEPERMVPRFTAASSDAFVNGHLVEHIDETGHPDPFGYRMEAEG